MPDREKVIKGLEMCKIMYCDECPYDDEDNCHLYLNQDALELLEEQEAVPPKREYVGIGITWWYVCGNCQTALSPNAKFCHECGRKVKWE